MRISDTKPSSVILGQKKYFQKLKRTKRAIILDQPDYNKVTRDFCLNFESR